MVNALTKGTITSETAIAATPISGDFAAAAENPELVQKYGIMTAPTLVVVKGNEVQKYVNASNIKRYVDEKAAVSV